MLKNWFFLFLFAIPTILPAVIRESTKISDLLDLADSDTLVLIDMDDTLTNSSISLGRAPWRHFVKKQLNGKISAHLHVNLAEYFAYQVFKAAPVMPVEAETVPVVQKLQDKGLSVLCFTARGKKQWYSLAVDDGEEVTIRQLQAIGLDFKNDILFTENKIKGDFIKEFFITRNFFPKKVLFIDDKLEQLESVEKAMEELQIPFTGLWYRKLELSEESFDMRIAMVQMEKYFKENILISDEEVVIQSQDPETMLHDLVSSLGY